MSGPRLREYLYVFAPDKKVFQVVVRISDAPGSLARILEILEGHINLVGVHTFRTGDGSAMVSAYAEAIDHGEEDPTALEKLILSSPSALACHVTEGSDGLLIDSFFKGLEQDNGEPLMIFRWDAFNQMFDRMSELFGTGAEVMLFYEGVSVGEANGAELVKRMGKETIERNMPTVIRMLSAGGWGSASLALSEAGTPMVRIDECFECSSKKGMRHGCVFIKGLITGGSRAILGPGAQCEETKCRLRGDDHCEFSISIVRVKGLDFRQDE
jgi:predicted hydrocarbon binding protein